MCVHAHGCVFKCVCTGRSLPLRGQSEGLGETFKPHLWLEDENMVN